MLSDQVPAISVIDQRLAQLFALVSEALAGATPYLRLFGSTLETVGRVGSKVV